MKSALQYIYSISVFFGVLTTSYFMMDKETTASFSLRNTFSSLNKESQIKDPVVDQLLEIESALTQIGTEGRFPAREIKIFKKEEIVKASKTHKKTEDTLPAK